MHKMTDEQTKKRKTSWKTNAAFLQAIGTGLNVAHMRNMLLAGGKQDLHLSLLILKLPTKLTTWGQHEIRPLWRGSNQGVLRTI